MKRSWASLEEFQKFLDHGGIVEPVDDMPREYRQTVFDFIEMHANSELMGGLTERDWIPKAPGLRHKMSVIAKTQDEIGHAHLLYMVAADLKIKTREEMMQDLFAGKSKFHNVFHYRAKTWGDQVAIAFLEMQLLLSANRQYLRTVHTGLTKEFSNGSLQKKAFIFVLVKNLYFVSQKEQRFKEVCFKIQSMTGGGPPFNYLDQIQNPMIYCCSGT